MKRKKPKKSQRAKDYDNPRSRYWRNRADKAWSELIRKVGACQKCGKGGRLEAHHLLNRGNHPTHRHSPENGIALCFGCHTGRGHSVHNDPACFVGWLKDAYPEKWEWCENHRGDVPIKIDYREAFERLQ